MELNIVFYALIACSTVAFLTSLYAIVRVVQLHRALKALDWEVLANLTGEVGAMKRSLQKVNSRISGMTSSDPATVLAELPRLQQVSPPTRTGG